MMGSIRVGLVGTGYAAKLRAEAFGNDSRSQLVAVAGHTPDRTRTFSETYSAEWMESWQELVARSDLDLVVIATVNRDHGMIARAALEAGKHVVVEYPLSLNVVEATELVQLASARHQLLHVEHVELLSGIHLAAKSALPKIGKPFHVRYASFNPQRPSPQKWTYHSKLFGFPLVGAVSRIHRLIDLFGRVTAVSCQARFWYGQGELGEQRKLGEQTDDRPYTSCLCTAHLRFDDGLIAEVIYGKGEAIWQSARSLEVFGEQGALFIEREQGTLVHAEQTIPLEVGSRRGLFAKDTTMILDHLTTNAPLYVSLESSLQALRVADAARRSAETGQTISLHV